MRGYWSWGLFVILSSVKFSLLFDSFKDASTFLKRSKEEQFKATVFGGTVDLRVSHVPHTEPIGRKPRR